MVPKYLCIEQGEVLRLQLEEMGQEVRELHQKYQTMLTVGHLDLYMRYVIERFADLLIRIQIRSRTCRSGFGQNPTCWDIKKFL